MSAVFSPCGKYRYRLTRERQPGFIPDSPPALFIMLNPSTADAERDDPTVRRCKAFAESWGCAGIIVVNLYAYRATKPSELWLADDPVGPQNDFWLAREAEEAGRVVCAWGANARPERVKQFRRMITDTYGIELYCLGTTKSGAPRHPLYVKNDQPLVPWPCDDRELPPGASANP